MRNKNIYKVVLSISLPLFKYITNKINNNKKGIPNKEVTPN